MGSSASAPASGPTKLEDKYYPEPGLWGPWWNFQHFWEIFTGPPIPGGMIQFDKHIVQIGLVPASTSMFFFGSAWFVPDLWQRDEMWWMLAKKSVRFMTSSAVLHSKFLWNQVKRESTLKGNHVYFYICMHSRMYTYINIISYIIYVLLYTFRIQVLLDYFQIAGYLDIGKNPGFFKSKSNTVLAKKWLVFTPRKINMEPKNHPIEIRKIIFQTIIFRFHFNLPGCRLCFRYGLFQKPIDCFVGSCDSEKNKVDQYWATSTARW